MKVYIEGERKYKNVDGKTINDILSKLKLNPTTVLVAVNNELVTEDYKLKKTDKVKIISVMSGG